MIEIEVSAAGARLLKAETLTAGRVGLRVRAYFDAAWDGLRKVAVVTGSRTADVLMGGAELSVPAECLREAGSTLMIGFYGTDAQGTVVIPTVWANCGLVLSSAEPSGLQPEAFTPSLTSQLLDAVATAVETAASVRRDADNGVFTGPAGPRGEQGPAGVQGPQGPQGERGPAGASLAYFDITLSDLGGGDYGADKTAAEILTAVAEGKLIRVVFNNGYNLCTVCIPGANSCILSSTCVEADRGYIRAIEFRISVGGGYADVEVFMEDAPEALPAWQGGNY